MKNYESTQQLWTFEHSLSLPLFVLMEKHSPSLLSISRQSPNYMHILSTKHTKKKLESKAHNEIAWEICSQKTVRFTLNLCSTICVCLKLNLIDKIFMPAIISTPFCFVSPPPRKVFKILNVLISNFSIWAKCFCFVEYFHGAHLPLWSIKRSSIRNPLRCAL